MPPDHITRCRTAVGGDLDKEPGDFILLTDAGTLVVLVPEEKHK